MAALIVTITFGQLYIDPAVNPLGITEAKIRASYRIIYSQYRVVDSPLLWKN
jgi:hypothetical protein